MKWKRDTGWKAIDTMRVTMGKLLTNTWENLGFTPPDGQYQYEGDQYFGEFDQVWSYDGEYYYTDDYGYYQDEQYHTHNDQEQQDDYMCPCPNDCSLPPDQCP